MLPLVKWSGSKRYLAKQIVSLIPEGTERFIDPFCGGCSIIPEIYNSGITNIRCSDINMRLIQIFRAFQVAEHILLGDYGRKWQKLQCDGEEYYYRVRDRFNKYPQAADLFFLSRTCYNGLIRFNRNGEFNTSFHVTRTGIHPDRLKKIHAQWKDVLSHTEFYYHDYVDILPIVKSGDIVFLDPPYSNSNGMYGIFDFDYDRLFQFMRDLTTKNARWILTLDSNIHNDRIDVPDDLFVDTTYGIGSNSNFRLLKNKEHTKIRECIYTNYNIDA